MISMPSTVVNPEHLRDFLNLIVDPQHATEFRTIQRTKLQGTKLVVDERFGTPQVGWYNQAINLQIDADMYLGNVSGYIIPNPCNKALLARANNRIIPAQKGQATTDNDVVSLRWMFLDFDAKRPSGISATDAELRSALDRHEEVLATHPELEASSIWGASGNGAWNLVRLPDYPNDEAHCKLIAKAVAYFAWKFSDPSAGVDLKAKNPSRLMCLPGTMKCKGEPGIEDRPWRPATLCTGDKVPVPFDLIDWVAGLPPEFLEPEPTSNGRSVGRTAVSLPMGGMVESGNAIERARTYLVEMKGAVSGQRGHDQAFDAACALILGFDLTKSEAYGLFCEWNAKCVPPWSEGEIHHKLDDAEKKPGPRGYLLNVTRKSSQGAAESEALAALLAGEDRVPHSTYDRPAIEVTVERHEVVDKSITALSATGGIYARGSVLVEVVEEPSDIRKIAGRTLDHVRGTPRVVTLSEAQIGVWLTKAATFYQMRGSKDGEFPVDCHPPQWLIQAVATKQFWPGIRLLKGIASAPCVDRFGALSPEGFNPDTGTLVCAPLVSGVPDRPTKEDAKAAVEILYKLVQQFPFRNRESFVVWLAGLLTIIQRPTIEGPTPGFAFNGNRAGTGKGLLIDQAGIIGTGFRVPTSIYANDPIEAQKVGVALAIDGTSVVHFDNLSEGQSYGSGPLDSEMTTTSINGRILGTSRMTGRLPLRPVRFLSGNNVFPGKDAHRRWLVAHLETSHEFPEIRDDLDVPDLRQHTTENRETYLMAALTILRAHAVAGRPSAKWAPLGSFEEWDGVIRSAVWFATGLDCCETMRAVAKTAPERQQKLAFLEGWKSLPEGGENGAGLTVQAAIKAVVNEPEKYPTLKAAFDQTKRDSDGSLSNRVIGKAISGMARANHDGLRFEKVDEKQHVALWRVVKVIPSIPIIRLFGEYGEFRESDLNPYVEALEYMLICYPSGFRI